MEKLNLYTFGELMEKAKKDGRLKIVDYAISNNSSVLNDLALLQSEDFSNNLNHYLEDNDINSVLYDKFAISCPRISTDYYNDGDIVFCELGSWNISDIDIDNDKLYELLKEYGEKHNYSKFQLSLIKYVCKLNLIDASYVCTRCHGEISFSCSIGIDREIYYLIEPALQELTDQLKEYLQDISDEIRISVDYTYVFTVDTKIVDGHITWHYVYKDYDNEREWIRDYLDSNGYLFTNEGDFICYQHNLDEGDIL